MHQLLSDVIKAHGLEVGESQTAKFVTWGWSRNYVAALGEALGVTATMRRLNSLHYEVDMEVRGDLKGALDRLYKEVYKDHSKEERVMLGRAIRESVGILEDVAPVRGGAKGKGKKASAVESAPRYTGPSVTGGNLSEGALDRIMGFNK